jgi:two-component system OmpR family sensor kinase
LLHHEKKAFLKFFLIYFLSVAILIIAAGFLHFIHVDDEYLKTEEFSMIDYRRQINMRKNLDEFSNSYRYEYLAKVDKNIDMNNFKIVNNEFVKYMPQNRRGQSLVLFKSAKVYKQKILELKINIAITQIILLLLFGYISYHLAKNALKPLETSIITLDKFTKDLIHDLNTPVTSIKLNMRILNKDKNFAENKALQRVNKSVYTISELHENLTTLLEEKTFQMQETNIYGIVQEVVQIQEQIYPKLSFQVSHSTLKAKINPNAMKQILQNIISNACKYNSKDGYIKIYTKNNSLYIDDSGSGIKEPNKIFERSYSTKHSTGIGLDIVKRLAKSMNIDIQVKSSSNGSSFILSFN